MNASENSEIDPTVIEALNVAQTTTMNSQVIAASGAGKAYQAVAQSAALAVQDSVDALRQASATATAASGVALAQFLASGDPRYLEALAQAQAMVAGAIGNLRDVGEAASSIVSGFYRG